MKTVQEMNYHSHEELLPFVGKELKFMVWQKERLGVLEFDGRTLWLPFCGRVKATTVLTELSK